MLTCAVQRSATVGKPAESKASCFVGFQVRRPYRRVVHEAVVRHSRRVHGAHEHRWFVGSSNETTEMKYMVKGQVTPSTLAGGVVRVREPRGWRLCARRPSAVDRGANNAEQRVQHGCSIPVLLHMCMSAPKSLRTLVAADLPRVLANPKTIRRVPC